MKYIIFTISAALALLGNEPQIRNQDVSPQQLQKQNKQIVQLAATELSKQLPQTIDKYTTLTKITPKDATLIYTFEINTGVKSDEAVRMEDRTRMEKAVTYGICKTSKRFMDAQITIVYDYISAKTKANLFTFKVDQNKCYKLFGN